MEQTRIGVIIVAGGSGKRMSSGIPKQFMLLDDMPILSRTINLFHKALPQAKIVAVLPEEYIDFWQNLQARFDTAKHKVVSGGKERFHSVLSGLFSLSEQLDIIAVQDAVRPMASVEMIQRCIQTAIEKDSACPVVPVIDSIREVHQGIGSRPVDRSKLRAVQTPQCFNANMLRQAYDVIYDTSFTDDASVWEKAGFQITLCDGERNNFKITTQEDLLHAQAIIKSQKE
ncbi:MAG: 2-C-methyl-D-erythritol 4-phosphate cytidylyltransferase [Alistipes sp.]|nr:2-C-methyl-D-erythritol 4-phosphate cytidylyltransferase [Candidatus Alistipes equi]